MGIYYTLCGWILLALLAEGHVLADGLDVEIAQNGNYKVLVNNVTWMSSAKPFVFADNQKHDEANGSLKLTSAAITTYGEDDIGSYEKKTLVYGWPSDVSLKTWHLSILKYKSQPVVVFEQFFPTTFEGTSSGNKNGVSSSFPSFALPTSQNLGLLAYAGVFYYGSDVIQKFTHGMKHVGDGIDGGPWVVFDKSGNAIVISPLNEFMASSVSHDATNNTVSWGVMGNATSVPAGFTYKTIMYYSSHGINHAMEGWGACLRHIYKKDDQLRYLDPTVRYLGYYTDNGAYYYQIPEPGMNFEQTLLGVVKYAKEQNIPYRYIQYDDWWYYITTQLGIYGATIKWEALPSVFPDGMQYIYNITRLPVIAHNRYWSSATVYAKQNGGDYEFLMDKDKSLPLEQDFWDYLFSYAVQWGLAVYEQDFLSTQTESISMLSSDVTLGRRWLTQMGESATRFGLRLQYCMALPRHVLQSVEISPVTQIRASGDYTSTGQWKIGASSMLANAVGLAPFKDNLWSTSVQPGNRYNRTEPSPLLQATIALLSTGPVGPSDRINYSNPALIRSLARADGTLLKPSKPATAINAEILEKAFGGGLGPDGEVYTTYSIVSRTMFGVVLAADLNDDYTISAAEAGFGPDFKESVVFPRAAAVGSYLDTFSNDKGLLLHNCTYVDFCLYYTSPVFHLADGVSVAIVGELEKVLPLSPHRISAVDAVSDDLIVTITGSALEEVTFHLYRLPQEWITYTCVLSTDGKATLSLKYISCDGV